MPDRRLPSAGKSLRNRGASHPPKAWGVGRVAFLARIDTIRAELAEGWPMTTVYGHHKDALGLGYSAFRRLVARHAADARPMPSRAANHEPKPDRQASASAAGLDSRAAAKPPPRPPSMQGSDAHAGHQPPRTFNHDPVERPGDYERLFGVRKR